MTNDRVKRCRPDTTFDRLCCLGVSLAWPTMAFPPSIVAIIVDFDFSPRSFLAVVYLAYIAATVVLQLYPYFVLYSTYLL